MNNNELIAEFIGVDTHFSDKVYKDSVSRLRHLIDNREKSEGLPFDTDWNWLIPVVEEIESYGGDENEFDIFSNCAVIGDGMVGEPEFVGRTKIEAVYEAVVWWINENYLQKSK